MRNSEDLAIGVLTITAAILVVGLVLATSGDRNAAYALGQSDRGGDYILVTGQFTENNEVVYITDAAARRLNLYSYEASTRQLVLWDSLDLKRVFGAAQP